MGRAVGCGVILATQRPTSDSIDTTTKALLTHRLALRCGDRYASEAILGPSQYLAANIPASAPGRAILASGAEPTALQVFHLDHSTIADPATPALRHELPWLQTCK
jgi:DNA segregation ATPase FtsK/SpoIIIE-like protein